MAIEIDKESFELDRLGKMMIRRRYLADSRTEALTGLPASVDGLPRASSSGSLWISSTDGRYVVNAVYEGLIESLAGPESKFDDYDIITEEKEHKIESFEPIDVLFEDYGAFYEDGVLKFPQNLIKFSNKLGQPLTLDSFKNTTTNLPNPLWNATSYSVMSSVAIWRMVRMRVPSSLVKEQQTVIDRLPAGFDYSGPKKQWYVRPLQRRKSGNAWTIEWSAMEIGNLKDLALLGALSSLASKR